MRTLLLVAWLMIPVLAGAYHYGPGQDRLKLDDTSNLLAVADRRVENGADAKAVELYTDALNRLPAGREAEAREIRLERAKAALEASNLPAAHLDLEALVEEMKADEDADPAVLDGAREALANTQYYLTWLMRLEGLGRGEWEPEIEAARQTYTLLAERAEAAGAAEAADRHREDLESAIRLARMDLGELQGLALPKQCNGCCSGDCQGKKPGNGKKKGKGKKTGENDARGASSGPPPDGSGS